MYILLSGLFAQAQPEWNSESIASEDTEELGPKDDEGRIINGESADTDDYPMAGGMLMAGTTDMWGGSDLRTFVCSSSLIAPDVVLLAAHCLDDYAFTFGMGEIEDKEVWWTRQSDLTSWDGSQQNPVLPNDAIPAWDWVIHPDFSMEDFGIGITQNDDIALIFLDSPVLDIDHAFLPTDNLGSQLEEGMEVAVVGWGQQIATGMWDAPPAGSYATKQMGVSSIDELGSHEFLVGALESDVRKCHGDSGGPSFLEMDGELRVVGVTSHAYDETDCFEIGGVDTRVDPYLDWIDEELKSRCDDGTRAWCDVPGLVRPSDYSTPVAEEESEKSRFFGCSASDSSPIHWQLLLLFVGLVWRRQNK
jgi:hypothetical protein